MPADNGPYPELEALQARISGLSHLKQNAVMTYTILGGLERSVERTGQVFVPGVLTGTEVASSSAAADSICVMPRARRRTEPRPTFAWSTGSRGAAARENRGRRIPPPGGHTLVAFGLAFQGERGGGPPSERCPPARCSGATSARSS